MRLRYINADNLIDLGIFSLVIHVVLEDIKGNDITKDL